MTSKEYLELRMAHQKFPDAMVHPASYFPCISFLLKQKNFRIHFVHRGSKLLRHSAREKKMSSGFWHWSQVKTIAKILE